VERANPAMSAILCKERNAPLNAILDLEAIMSTVHIAYNNNSKMIMRTVI
jgi:hypothetical protein